MPDQIYDRPGSITVVFPRSDYDSVNTSTRMNSGIRVEHHWTVLVLGSGHGGTQVIHSTALANFEGGSDPVNIVELQALAAKIAADWYAWRNASLEIRYESAVPWIADGMHDIEWMHGQQIATAVHRSEWEPEFGQLQHSGTFGSSVLPKICGAQGVKVVTGIKVNGKFDGRLQLRDNGTKTDGDDTPIWIYDWSGADSLWAGAKYNGVFRGIEAGGLDDEKRATYSINAGGGTTDCHAILDECSGTIYYQRVINGLVSNSLIPCEDCRPSPDPLPPPPDPLPPPPPPDPPPLPDPITTPCCPDNPLPAVMCMVLGSVQPELPDDTLEPFGNRHITLNYVPGQLVWSGTIPGPLTGGGPSYFYGEVRCNQDTLELGGFAVWVLDNITSYLLFFDAASASIVCDPFHMGWTGRVKYSNSVNPPPVDLERTILVTVIPDACSPVCIPGVTVTENTADLAGNTPYITITGTGFSTTPAANIVTFDNGAAGTCVSATTTSLLVMFTVQPQNLGPLTAYVQVGSCFSDPPVEVANIIAPLTGIEIVGVGKGVSATYSVTVESGMLVVHVALYGAFAASAPSVTYDGGAMTLDASTNVVADPSTGIYSFSKVVSAGTGSVVITPVGGFDTLQTQALNIKGLASKLVDKTKTATGTSSAPDTGATAATAVADEAVIGAFANVNLSTTTFTWTNSFVSGNQNVHSVISDRDLVLTEGRRILSATGTVDAAATPSGVTCVAWAGLVVTYK